MPKKKKAAKEAPPPAEEVADDKFETPPEGCKPMMISGKDMNKYELKLGDGLRDTKPFAEFELAWILKEIQDLGVYSAFAGFKGQLAVYPEDEKVLLVADNDETYGENWLICVTSMAKDAQYQVVQDKVNAEAAAQKAIEDEIARKAAEEYAAANAVYEDKPIVINPWVTPHAKETVDAVNILTITPARPLMKIGLVRKRRELGQQFKFTPRQDPGNMTAECRQHKDPNYDLKRNELDAGLQAVPQRKEEGTQTTRFRSVNKTIQYEAIEMGEDKMAEQVEDRNLGEFLKRAHGDMEEALQQNETFNLFKDEFKDLGEEELALGNKSENKIKELKTFTDLEYSKNKALPAVDWHPKKKGIVAVAAVQNLSFDQRIEISGKVSTSYLLIWNFTDLIHPQLMLESPHDTHCFRFNPSHPNLVAAGCISGQVILWDVTEAQEQLNRKKGKTVASQEDEEEHDKMLPPVRHFAMSQIDSSHRRPVADIQWLPPGMEVNHKGVIEVTEETKSYQFITVAGDGQVCIWDIRYKDQYKKNPRLHKEIKPNKDGTMPEIQWQPQYKLALTKLEGVGELALARMNLQCWVKSLTPEAKGSSFSSAFYCTTEEGEMVYADWKPAGGGGGGGAAAGGDDGEAAAAGGEGDGPENVEWMSQDHFRPCVSLERSPFFPDILLSVSDWSFNLWKEGLKTPLFSSPIASAYLTTGRWSPTRPGVLMVSKADGSIDVWDFTDQSHKPSATNNIAPSRITSMEFWNNTSNSKSQLLAVGDSNGNLHILDTPRNLWRPLNNEKEIMDSFFQREVKHVEYVKERMHVRAKEREAKEHEEEQQQATPPEVPDAGAQAAEEAKAEEAYRAMERAFRAELGLDTGEIEVEMD